MKWHGSPMTTFLPTEVSHKHGDAGFIRAALGLSVASALFTLLLRLFVPTIVSWSLAAAYLPHILFAYFLYGGMALVRGQKLEARLEALAPAIAGLGMGLCLPAYQSLGVIVFGAVLGSTIPERTSPLETRLATAASAAVACLIGALSFGALQSVSLLGTLLPDALIGGILGAIFGLHASLGALPNFLESDTDPVKLAYERARKLLTGKLLDNAARCWAVYSRILEVTDISLFTDVDEYGEFRTSLRDIMLRTFDLSCRWEEVEAFLARINKENLEKRISEVEKKLATTNDEVARKEYERIRTALDRRMDEHSRLVAAKERVLSRLEYYFTVLEDLHLATVRLKSSNAQADSIDGAALTGKIEDLAKDLSATSRALEELGISIGDQTSLTVDG